MGVLDNGWPTPPQPTQGSDGNNGTPQPSRTPLAVGNPTTDGTADGDAIPLTVKTPEFEGGNTPLATHLTTISKTTSGVAAADVTDTIQANIDAALVTAATSKIFTINIIAIEDSASLPYTYKIGRAHV